MPRKPKYVLEEWAFFLNGFNRMQYCEQCKKCTFDCKQSFRIRKLYCPKYHSKRSIK